MKASLLSSDGDDDLPMPLVDGSVEDDAVSEFSRLILLSAAHNPDDALLDTVQTRDSVLMNPNSKVILNYRRQRREISMRCISNSESETDRNHPLQMRTIAKAPPPCSPSFTIVVSGACTALFVAFIWASFASNSWSETVLVVLMELPTLTATSTSATVPPPHLPMLLPLFPPPIAVQANTSILPVPIASTTLSSIIQLFLQADQTGISTLLWLSSLFLPCLFMVLTPSWIVQVYSTNKDEAKSNSYSYRYDRQETAGTSGSTTGHHIPVATGIAEGESSLRHGLHLLFRGVFTVVFVMLLITSSCQHIKMEWSNSLVSVQNKIGNGLATYTVSVSFAIIAISVLRLGSAEYSPYSFRHTRQHTVPQDLSLRGTRSIAEWERSVEIDSKVNNDLLLDSIPKAIDDGPQMMRILEDGPLMEAEATGRAVFNTDEASLLSAFEAHSGGVWETVPTTFCQIFTVFQVGLLSILLWIPSIILPILQFEYSGFASELIPRDVVDTLSLYEVPLVLHNDGIMAKSPPWIVWLIGTLTFGLIVACPLIAIGLCIATWMVPPDSCHPTARCWSRRTLRAWLSAIHPAVGTIVLAVSVFIASHGVETWSNYVFNVAANRHYICGQLERLAGESCLVIRGRPMAGAWFYLFHAIFLEGFILFTHRWS